MWNGMFKPVWAAKESGRRWWLWFFVFLSLELLLIRWLRELQRQRSKPPTSTRTEIEMAQEPLPEPPEEAPLQVAKEPLPEPEKARAPVEKVKGAGTEAADFRRIEGIGPKVNQLLHEAGIRTYQQLADSSEEGLRGTLREANLYMINPETWPEQAQIAASGDWERLKALQEELKGGRLRG
jgi:predicted flap endonuclease-1-like 5' DNA nuclease